MVPVTAWTLRKTARIFSRLLQPRAWGSAIAEKRVSVDRNRNGAFQRSSISRNPLNFANPDAPWCWNIYLHFPQKLPSFVGKYSSTMVRIWANIGAFPQL